MVFPLWVQGLSERRWPYVTTAIILINCAVFLMTHMQIEEESQKTAQIESPLLMIAAAHPEAQPPADAKLLIDSFAQDNKQLWNDIGSSKQPPTSEWDQEMRDWGAAQASDEMQSLAVQLKAVQQDSILEKYAFHPYKPTLLSLVTANFLHGGWLHLIFNMWFLWLAGGMMESAWGPGIFAAFYFLAGAAGLLAHGTTYPHSILPVLGASGAVAGLIGGFLIRFPEAKIDLFAFFVFRFVRFAWPAYLVLPLWLVAQIVWGSLTHASGGVAYWAHVGGFVFGALIAIALRHMGLERVVGGMGEPEWAG